MSTPILLRNTATNIVVYLEATTGLPATGLTSTSVTASIKKEGALSFSSFALSGGNFSELGNGFYLIVLVAGNTDTVGSLYMEFTGTGVTPTLFSGTVVAVVAQPTIPPQFVLPTTVLFGYIYDGTGNPLAGVTVFSRALVSPQILTPGVALSSDPIVVKTDASGYFTLTLITGSQADVQIPGINYRRTLTVPSTSVNLFEIL